MNRYRVVVAADLVAHHLTRGAEIPGARVLEGLPEGCRLVRSELSAPYSVALYFELGKPAHPNDNPPWEDVEPLLQRVPERDPV